MNFKGIISFLLTVSMLFSMTAFAADKEEFFYVELGSYPQSEVEASEKVINAEYDSSGDALIDGNKYKRVGKEGSYRYFLYEPLTWLKWENILISTNIIDCKMYDEQEERIKNFMGGVKYADSVAWEDCSLRKWLNEEFLATAFSDEEAKLLKEEIGILKTSDAKTLDKGLRCKTATDYALFRGVKKHNTGSSQWFLKDASPIGTGTVCTVKYDGDINEGITVLVNEPDVGIVPVIYVTDFSGLNTYTQKAPEELIEMYYPGGRTANILKSEADKAIADGWTKDKKEAFKTGSLNIKNRFQASPLNEVYDWRLYTPSGKQAHIAIDAPSFNMTPGEIIKFVKPIMDTFYTGKMEDYMEVHVKFMYDENTASSFKEFSSGTGKAVHDAVEACWSGWGNITCSDGGAGRLTGTEGVNYSVTLRLKINGDGSYSLSATNYHDILHKLAGEAKAYSERPLGQLQYLRHYFGQNTVYDGRQFNNEPSSLIDTGVGVCGSYANFTMDFCKLLGIPCILYTNEKAAHAWNGVFVEGKWYHIDHTGESDKEFMQNSYSNYMAGEELCEFSPEGFPLEHKAENISFLKDSYLPVDNLSPENISLVHTLFAKESEALTGQEIKVTVNGKKLDFDVAPVIENGRTLVPMRKIFEALGATVYWNDETKTVTAVKDVTVISIGIDSRVLIKNGENISLDVPARLINSRTLVPVRVIAESFGLQVLWDDSLKTVTIK